MTVGPLVLSRGDTTACEACGECLAESDPVGVLVARPPQAACSWRPRGVYCAGCRPRRVAPERGVVRGVARGELALLTHRQEARLVMVDARLQGTCLGFAGP